MFINRTSTSKHMYRHISRACDMDMTSTKPQRFKKNKNPTMYILWKFQLFAVSRTCCVVHIGFILHTLFIHLDCSHLVITKRTSRVQWRFPRHQNHWWIDDLDRWAFHHIRCWNLPFWVAYSKSSYVLRVITISVQVLLVNIYTAA